MKQVLFSSSIVLLIMLASCGGWADNIKLSIKNVEFRAEGDSVIVTTKGDWWWVTGISVDDTNYYNFEGIDVLSNNYRIAKDCFVVERQDKNTLFIKLDANPLSTDRIVRVELEAGDYFDRVTITQKHF
jgi:hypothetical protein